MKFQTIQRCWAHILREAELLAATQGGLLIELHHELLYHARLLPPDISDEGL